MLNIFQYLQEKKGKKIPFEYKLIKHSLLSEDDLTHNGYLSLSWSKIISLPNNLTVNGNLSLFKSKINSLPNNLRVETYLNIEYTLISELPDDLYVGGNLYCYGTPLAKRIKNDVTLLTKYQDQVEGRIYYDR